MISQNSKLREQEIQVAMICQKSGGYPNLVLNFENNSPLSTFESSVATHLDLLRLCFRLVLDDFHNQLNIRSYKPKEFRQIVHFHDNIEG